MGHRIHRWDVEDMSANDVAFLRVRQSAHHNARSQTLPPQSHELIRCVAGPVS
jgi:hypothetical protein